MKLAICALLAIVFAGPTLSQTQPKDDDPLTLEQVQQMHLRILGLCSGDRVISKMDRDSIANFYGVKPDEYKGKKMEVRCTLRYGFDPISHTHVALKVGRLFLDGKEVPIRRMPAPPTVRSSSTPWG